MAGEQQQPLVYPVVQPVEYLGPMAQYIKAKPRVAAPLVQVTNVVYCEHEGAGLLLDIFRHPEKRNGLAIIDVVSREWYGDRLRLNQHIALGVMDVLCEAGFTVFAVSPGSVPQFCAGQQLRHLQAGIRFVKRLAEDYGVDPERIGLTGMSAGGHLAALAALSPAQAGSGVQGATVAAAGLFFPVTDLAALGAERFADATPKGFSGHVLFPGGINGKSADEVQQRLAALSPIGKVVGNAPPFLVFHGTADPLIPHAHSEAFVAALAAARAEARCVLKEDGAHPWPDMRPEIGQLAEWFGTILKSTQ